MKEPDKPVPGYKFGPGYFQNIVDLRVVSIQVAYLLVLLAKRPGLAPPQRTFTFT